MKALRTKFVLPAALLAVALGVLGCYPKSGPAPGALSADSATWASTKWPGTTPESLAAGHDAFIAKCNACHGYPELSAIDDEEWPGIVESMGNKAELDASKKEAVLHFILAARHQP